MDPTPPHASDAADDGASLFRAEALRHRAMQREETPKLLGAPAWVFRAFWILVLSVFFAGAAGASLFLGAR
jgi:hypothetical protein